ncbi:MAG: orotidine-5'-phosphate decarboxylase [Candidatus Improbicoccus pseudotrichonymphae]|uniref:Orotidine 5'-phosphate decarboxylase n=1 Tax=Candidatus Improbicoccus pseudotrichonymphae TaxID=3033792 RepID=A0AA48I1C6_9FIRM|nr:MAG: orotidine-5'-phosphate decarboxylase [Candidatus Improbicoccus pseudotrichonymphae]
MLFKPQKDVIVACDFSDNQIFDFLEKFQQEDLFIKIGMELFYKFGPDIIRKIKKKFDFKIFLDLKLHDIPNTVFKAVSNLVELEVDFITVHASGGKEMMMRAGDAAKNSTTKIFAVTVLTSMPKKSLRKEIFTNENLDSVVLAYANNAFDCNLSGIICSVKEVRRVKNKFSDLLCITPGIRYEKTDIKDDQVRVATPEKARREGSDFIVVGRPIILSDDPLSTYQKIRKEFTRTDL